MTIEKILTTLQHEGVETITAEYNGCGDSGQIETINFAPQNIEMDSEALDVIKEFIYNNLPGRWEINEGSTGTFTIDLKNKSINNHHGDYVQNIEWYDREIDFPSVSFKTNHKWDEIDPGKD